MPGNTPRGGSVAIFRAKAVSSALPTHFLSPVTTHTPSLSIQTTGFLENARFWDRLSNKMTGKPPLTLSGGNSWQAGAMTTTSPARASNEFCNFAGQLLSGSPLIPASRLQEVLGRDPCTLWRWRKRRWLPPLVFIGGRAYYQTSELTEFFRRAAAGDFATPHCPPLPTSIGKGAKRPSDGGGR